MMVEPARRHGPFDTRYPVRPKLAAPTWELQPGEDGLEGLGWSEFCIRNLVGLLQITERATQRVVADLAGAGYIDRERQGRRNVYSVRTSLPLGLPLQRDVDIGTLLAVLAVPDDDV